MTDDSHESTSEGARPFEQRGGNSRNKNRTRGRGPSQNLETSGQIAGRSDGSEQVSTSSESSLDNSEVVEGEVLEEEVRRRVDKVLMQAEMYSGPLPPATELAKYEEAMPGSAREILDMAKNTLSAANDATRANAEISRAVARSMDTRGELEIRRQSNMKWLTWAVLGTTVLFAYMDKPIPAIFSFILLVASGAAYSFLPRLMETFYPESGKSEGEGG